MVGDGPQAIQVVARAALSDLVMAWDRNSAAVQPRYILELDAEPPTAATPLKVTTPPLADTARYESLLAQGSTVAVVGDDGSVDNTTKLDLTTPGTGHEA